MANEIDPKEYLVKAKLYRFTAYLFFAIGFAIFIALYIKNIDGRVIEAFKEIRTIFIFIMPFAPAAVLSILGEKANKKYIALSNKDTNKDSVKNK